MNKPYKFIFKGNQNWKYAKYKAVMINHKCFVEKELKYFSFSESVALLIQFIMKKNWSSSNLLSNN